MTLTVPVVRESAVEAGAGIIATDIPARLDRLRWGRFHTLVVVALGITWILDGLEVTLAGAVSPALKESPQLGIQFITVRRRSKQLLEQVARTPMSAW